MNKKKNILVIGGTSVDTIIQIKKPMKPGPQTIRAKNCTTTVGGTGAGKSLNLARLDFNVTLHSIIGKDILGQSILSFLEHPDISLLIDKSDQPTEQHTNLMTPDGERISIYTHPPANLDNINWESIKPILKTADMVAINILDYARPALKLAKAAGKNLWIDIHDYDQGNAFHHEFIQAADVLFLSDINLPDYRNFMQQQIKAGKDFIICTHGAEGSTALDKNGVWYKQNSVSGYELIDSNGAGDAYFSGFTYAYYQDKDFQTCMHYGAITAALCINSPHLSSIEISPEKVEQIYSEEIR